MRVARKQPMPAEFRKAQKEVASLLDNYVGDLDFWPKMIKKRVQALKKIFNESFEGEVSKNTLIYVAKIKKDISDVSSSFKDIHELLGEMIKEHGDHEDKKQYLGAMNLDDLSGLSEADWDQHFEKQSWQEEGWRVAAKRKGPDLKIYSSYVIFTPSGKELGTLRFLSDETLNLTLEGPEVNWKTKTRVLKSVDEFYTWSEKYKVSWKKE